MFDQHPVCSPFEAHHAYWGIILMIIAQFFMGLASPVMIWSIIITLLVTLASFFEIFRSDHYKYIIIFMSLLFVLFIYHFSLCINNISWWSVLLIFGWDLYMDDFYQHYHQWADSSYHSPIHKFVYNVLKINQIQWIKDFTAWIDKLLGKK